MKISVWLKACIPLAVFAGVPVAPAVADDDILINDFEAAGYGNWKVEGNAFGVGPARGTLPGQMKVSGFQGKGLVNTFLGGDDPMGTLSSPEFLIDRDYIKFLIGGGGHEGRTCVDLLVDGEKIFSASGFNTEPGGSEALEWETWDVKKHRGRKAVIRIVDAASGGWGHVNVDQIVQSNTAVKRRTPPARRPRTEPPPEHVRELMVDGRYLLFPVSNGGKRGRLTLHVGEQLVHQLDCDFAPGVDAVDWWGWLDVSEYAGKTARISVQAAPEVAGMIECGDQLREAGPPYDEELRPQFHMSQMRGWNNDPNGMFYHDGRYHFFWQSNPGGWAWRNMYWGYATSPDMVHWTEHDHALRPFGGQIANRHPSMAVKECFSGSGHVDAGNTAGWQKGREKTMVLAFTDTGCGECLAYSTDGGGSWTYHEGNPVIKHSGRDPKLIWYEPGRHWVIAVYDEREPIGRNIAFYTSRDLKEWEYASSVPGYFECPEIVELPVDGDPAKNKWVIFAADARYAIGHFDGRKFTPEHEGKHQVHWGAYYASQCFSGAPDGRVVQIGWARIDMPGMPFNQTFSLPTELTLRTTADGIRMFAAPIKELETLRKPGAQSVVHKDLTAEAPAVELGEADQLFDIVATLRKGTASKAVLRFGGSEVVYDFVAEKLDEMPLKMKAGVVSFRVLVDRPMFEVVGGDGECYKTSARKDMGRPLGSISLSAQGGSFTIESFTVHEMNPAWKKQ